jgi:hypothetical protein
MANAVERAAARTPELDNLHAGYPRTRHALNRAESAIYDRLG